MRERGGGGATGERIWVMSRSKSDVRNHPISMTAPQSRMFP